MKQFFRAKRKK